jgi:hypothetical protein
VCLLKPAQLDASLHPVNYVLRGTGLGRRSNPGSIYITDASCILVAGVYCVLRRLSRDSSTLHHRASAGPSSSAGGCSVDAALADAL